LKKYLVILCIILSPAMAMAWGVMCVSGGVEASGGGNPTELLRPDADSTTTDWTYTTNGYYQDVSDETDSTYIYATNQSLTCGFYLDDTSSSSGKTIVSVTLHGRIRNTTSSSIPDLLIYTNGTYYYALSGITASFVEYTEELTENPNTSAAWTSTEIDSLYLGARTPGSANTTQVADLWVTVEYTE